MIYITGDTHGEMQRFSRRHLGDYKPGKDDYVIICGDFGLIWERDENDPTENYWLDWLSEKPYTILFVDGNHENFDRLKKYPRVDFHGGKAHKIKDNIYHLMRGYVFNIDERKIFAFGGASSHDIPDGIMYPDKYPTYDQFLRDYRNKIAQGKMFRVNKVSWWKEELPNKREMDRGIANLQKVNFEVDYVITHSLPTSIAALAGFPKPDVITNYFELLVNECNLKFKKWYSGHYHKEKEIDNKYIIKYWTFDRV